MQDGWLRAPWSDSSSLPPLRRVAGGSSGPDSSTTGSSLSSVTSSHGFSMARLLPPQVEESRSPPRFEQVQDHHHLHQQQQKQDFHQYPQFEDQRRLSPQRFFVKQEAFPLAPSRPRTSVPATLSAPSALPKLSHMLRASSLSDVNATNNARQNYRPEPEKEPDYESKEQKSSIGFLLGGQNHATYTSAAPANVVLQAAPVVAMSYPSGAQDSTYYPQYSSHPLPMTTHAGSSAPWNQGTGKASLRASSPHSLASSGRAASAPSLLSAGLPQRKVETARPASRTCKFEGCEQYVVDHGLCVRHGGGKRCLTEGCTSRAKHFGRCWRHGGSIECKVEGCINRAKSRGYCWSHGGGTKCKAHPCEKIAISNGLCWAHGGGKRCVVNNCRKQAYERTRNFCNSHFQLYKKGLLPASVTMAVEDSSASR